MLCVVVCGGVDGRSVCVMGVVCSDVQWVVCFPVCMVCPGLEMGLSVCGVCLASLHVLIALWFALSFLGRLTFVEMCLCGEWL